MVLVVVASCLLAAGASVATAGQGRGRIDDAHDGGWLAGDFHVHTIASHDSYGGPNDPNTGPEEFYTFGWSAGEQGDLALTRGLDFIAITDHNNVDALEDPAASGYGTEGLIWVPGYENSLPGHAQLLGIDEVLSNNLIDEDPDPLKNPEATRADVEALQEEVRERGGIFQINHPSDMKWFGRYDHQIVPDTVEVWNIGPWLYQRPFPASNDNDYSLTFWDEFLDLGEQVAATGGSDNHWRTVTAAAGVGQPTTWVFTQDQSVEGILEGLREGRTTISNQPPAYPTAVFAMLEADEDGDGDGEFEFESMIGDKVLPGSRLRATVEGADGSYLRLVTNKSATLALEEIDSDDYSFEIDVPEKYTWVRAEIFRQEEDIDRTQFSFACNVINIPGEEFGDGATTYCTKRLLVLALTSPIYFGLEPSPSPSPASEL